MHLEISLTHLYFKEHKYVSISKLLLHTIDYVAVQTYNMAIHTRAHTHTHTHT